MSTILPERPAPQTFAWALLIDHARLVVVVEPSYSMDAPPGLHLALSASRNTVDTVLAGNGWTARAWLPRSWGRIARVDLEET